MKKQRKTQNKTTSPGVLPGHFLNSSLNGLSFAQDKNGNWGYKVGADAVVPFKSGVNYVLWDMGRYDSDRSYTFSIVPDKVYIMYGASASGGISMTGVSKKTTQWEFAGEGYWNGGFHEATVSKTVTFSKSSTNRGFVLMFW